MSYPGTRVGLGNSTRYRTRCVEHIREIFGSIGYTNTEDNVCHKRIPFRENGVMMIGDFQVSPNGDISGISVPRLSGLTVEKLGKLF